MMNIAIASIGLATAQGNVTNVLNGNSPRPPAELLWSADRWTTCRFCRPVHEIDPALSGAARWQALAKAALDDCLSERMPSAETALLIASCNGGAEDFNMKSWGTAFDARLLLAGIAWAGVNLPVISASCASGLHALYLARQLLATGRDEVIILAVDILSASNHDNFEGLRVLSSGSNPPWQATGTGFLLGEAAVAMRLVPTKKADSTPCLAGPVLGNDLNGNHAPERVLQPLAVTTPDLILGQGTGPAEIDAIELSALRSCIDLNVPLATPLTHFGHTLGASGLLSVALAALAPLPLLSMPAPFAVDGRPLANGSTKPAKVMIVCRALSGACAAACISTTAYEHNPSPVSQIWQQVCAPEPLMHEALQRIAEEAMPNRPAKPPDMLIVWLEAPLAPRNKAYIGGRLLPSAVLEITPGFVPQLIARCWGFTGPAFCLVGETSVEVGVFQLFQACRNSHRSVRLIRVRGNGDHREVEWNV
jgi:hypothetical protein